MVNDEVKFVVVSPIVTKARPRARVVKGKFAQVYTPTTTVNYENLIKTQYGIQCHNHYFGEAPLSVYIEAKFGKSKDLEKYGGFSTYIPSTTHKDCDNIAKTILDALNGVAYKDDKQVWSLNVTKVVNNSSQDEIVVSIKEEGRTIEQVKEKYNEQKEYEKYAELMNLSQTKKLTKKQLEWICKYQEDHKHGQ